MLTNRCFHFTHSTIDFFFCTLTLCILFALFLFFLWFVFFIHYISYYISCALLLPDISDIIYQFISLLS